MLNKPDFIKLLADNGQIMLRDAERVFNFYKKNKILKVNPSHGYEIKHGAYLESIVINNAVNYVNRVKL